MTRKILSAVLALIMVVSMGAFTAFADDAVYYVEAGATAGDGSKSEPFGSVEEAITALAGAAGTVKIIGELDMSTFKAPAKWEGMVTVTGDSADSKIALADGRGIVFEGPITFKDIKFNLGKNTHFNPQGTLLVMDGGEGSDFTSFMHICMYGSQVVEKADYIQNSGNVSVLYSGGYCSSLANGVMGDSNITINGGRVGTLSLSADSYKEDMTGISFGGNYNVVVNGGTVGAITVSRPKTVIEIMGALNIIFNNGTQAPEKFDYPENIPGGAFIIKSAEGGMITPVADEIGAFNVKANSGKIAVINGEQVPNGVVNLEPGETEVTWVDGVQEEPIEIKLTIDSKEIVKNGVATELDVPAQIVDSRTLVPLRAIFEALGASVEWDGETSTVTSEKDGTAVKLTIGENKIYVNGEAKELDVPAQIIDSRTMVPARAVAEAYGCAVEWDGDTRTVIIKK